MDYNKLLEKARKVYAECVTGAEKRRLESIFPELEVSEDERIGKQLLNWFKDCHWDSIDDGTLKRDDIIAWLEKQGEQKWSEDDKEIFEEACKIINSYGNIITEQNEANKAYKIADKLKSLKPQSHWKPTKEQMTALKIVKKGFPADDLDAIESLYNDLKKL